MKDRCRGMSHETGSCYCWTSCRCSNNTLRRGMSHWGTPTVLVILSMSLRLTQGKPSLPLSPHPLSQFSISVSLSSRSSRLREQRNVGFCAGSRPVCTPVNSTAYCLCFPREACRAAANPPVLFLQHTQWNIFYMQVCVTLVCWSAAKVITHTNDPKINHNMWEHKPKPNVMTKIDFYHFGGRSRCKTAS